MKQIIQRALPLQIKYTLIGKKYVPLEEQLVPCTCDNCGAIIANIATVRSETGSTYSIGFDCFETILLNNNLLSSGDAEAYEKAKKMIPKFLRFAKTIKKVIAENREAGNIITGMHFEPPMFTSDAYYTFYWLTGEQETSRNNDYVKLKDIEISFLIETLKNIFPNLKIIYK